MIIIRMKVAYQHKPQFQDSGFAFTVSSSVVRVSGQGIFELGTVSLQHFFDSTGMIR